MMNSDECCQVKNKLYLRFLGNSHMFSAVHPFKLATFYNFQVTLVLHL